MVRAGNSQAAQGTHHEAGDKQADQEEDHRPGLPPEADGPLDRVSPEGAGASFRRSDMPDRSDLAALWDGRVTGTTASRMVGVGHVREAAVDRVEDADAQTDSGSVLSETEPTLLGRVGGYWCPAL
jgi:hypothetical protein